MKTRLAWASLTPAEQYRHLELCGVVRNTLDACGGMWHVPREGVGKVLCNYFGLRPAARCKTPDAAVMLDNLVLERRRRPFSKVNGLTARIEYRVRHMNDITAADPAFVPLVFSNYEKSKPETPKPETPKPVTPKQPEMPKLMTPKPSSPTTLKPEPKPPLSSLAYFAALEVSNPQAPELVALQRMLSALTFFGGDIPNLGVGGGTAKGRPLSREEILLQYGSELSLQYIKEIRRLDAKVKALETENASLRETLADPKRLSKALTALL